MVAVAVCSGSDVVTAQAFETMAWLISPPVVGVVGGFALLFVAGVVIVRFAYRISGLL